MACMEHECRECNHLWFDNKPSGVCALCGSTNVAHTFDEDPQEHEDTEAGCR